MRDNHLVWFVSLGYDYFVDNHTPFFYVLIDKKDRDFRVVVFTSLPGKWCLVLGLHPDTQ